MSIPSRFPARRKNVLRNQQLVPICAGRIIVLTSVIGRSRTIRPLQISLPCTGRFRPPTRPSLIRRDRQFFQTSIKELVAFFASGYLRVRCSYFVWSHRWFHWQMDETLRGSVGSHENLVHLADLVSVSWSGSEASVALLIPLQSASLMPSPDTSVHCLPW